MTIKLIDEATYNRLLEIQRDYPILTYQNKGYDTIDRTKLNEAENAADKEVTEILNKSIIGFRKFSNFKLDKNGQICLRVQYDYNADTNGIPFTGVGYLKLIELHKGFEE